MMEKLEKVITALECCGYTDYMDKCQDCPYDGKKCFSRLKADALDLLKERKPVKPTRYQEGRRFKTWRCGACGGTLVFRNGTDKPKYCTDCGKAVKWDD